MSGITFQDKLLIFLWLINQKKGLKNEVYIKNQGGLFYFPKDYGVWESSIYDGNEMKPYFKINRGTFIDVGANIGKYTLIIGNRLKDIGRVISIEPEKRNFSVLKKNVEINKLNNIILENVALSNKNGVVKLYLNKSPGRHSIKRVTENKTLVQGVKLDDLIKKYKITDVNLVKIDVETAEVEVLEGAVKTIKKNSPNMIIEILNQDNFRKVRNILKGYKFKKISKTDYYFYKEQNNKKFKEK
jgi:FkbM family methyltransferase